jgi:hypothetical protein
MLARPGKLLSSSNGQQLPVRAATEFHLISAPQEGDSHTTDKGLRYGHYHGGRETGMRKLLGGNYR